MDDHIDHEPLDPITRRINHIGCGNSQLATYLVATVMLLCDGQEMLVMSLVSLRLKILWNLSPAAEGTLGSCVFAGVLIGSVCSGSMADKLGRRFTVLVFMSILAVAGLASAIAPSFLWLVFIRTVAGIGLGGTIPTTSTLISEIVPDRLRAIAMLTVGVGFALGESITAMQAMLLDVNVGEHWRWLLALSAFPAFLSLIITLLFLEESPRFLNANGKEKEAMVLLNKMELQNQRSLCCCCCSGKEAPQEPFDDGPEDDTADLLLSKTTKTTTTTTATTATSTEPPSDQSCMERNQMTELFEAARPLDTAMVWLIFAIVSAVFYGLIWVFPLTLKEGGGQEDNSGVASKVLYSAMAELPAIVIPIFFIDWIGRKGTMSLFFLICMPIAVACALLAPKLSSPAESNAYFWSVMGLKCTISVVYNVIYVYAAEYVPSKVRGFAIGMGSASARIGGIATPYAMVLLHRSHIALPYWFMVGACTVGLMASLVMVEVGKHMR